MRAAIYTRVSAKKSLDGVSLEQQLTDCEAYAKRHHMQVTAVYTDRAKTGRNDNRPELQRLQADAARKAFDVVIVWKLDRCARNTWLQLKVVDDLLKTGIRLYSTTEQIEYETAAGRYMLTMLAGSAEMFSNLLSERMKRTFSFHAEQGRWVGPVPIGYQRHPERRTLVPTDDAPAVQLAFALYATGQYSYASVADALNQHGYRIHNPQTGKRNLFGKFTVRELLANPVYIGKIRHNGDLYPGQHDRLIDDVTWLAVQDIRERHRAKAGQVSVSSGFGMLTELVYCEQCGARMWHHNKVQYPYYVCSSRHRRTCQAPGVPARHAEARIYDLLKTLAIPADWQRRIILLMQDLYAKRQQPTPDVDVPAVERRLARLQHLYLDGDIGEIYYREERGKLQAMLRAQPPAAPVRELDIRKAVRTLGNLHDLVKRSHVVKQRAILREVFASLWIGKKNGIAAIQPREPYLALVQGIAAISTNGEPGGQWAHLTWNFPAILEHHSDYLAAA
jgi:site-specific DNA recombinase